MIDGKYFRGRSNSARGETEVYFKFSEFQKGIMFSRRNLGASARE